MVHDLLGLIGDIGEALTTAGDVADNRLIRKRSWRLRLILFGATFTCLCGLLIWSWASP